MAYAAVISLKHTIQRLENSINKPQLTKSAYEELNSLQSMLDGLDKESSRCIDRSEINELDAKMREAVWKVEDVLESCHSLNISSSEGCLDEKGVEEEMNSFLKTVKTLGEEYYRVLQNPLSGDEEDDAAAVPPVNKSTTVGLSDLSEDIINQLLDMEFGRQFHSVFGMAGIGKTHLATDIYHHPLIVQHFHSRVWVSVGPKHRKIEKIIVDIVAQMERKPRYLFKEKSMNTLTDIIQNNILTRRHLIVLDDIWSTQVLYGIVSLFPGFVNGSRVLVTTRLQEVARYYSGSYREMPFLNNEESWDLLWQNVFVAEKSFPPQLEKPGRKIAEKCEGLPLLILAVANILRGLDKTQEYWEKVAEKKTTTFTDAYDQIYEVLLPSYEYLPQYLKPCFLYMGVFPQSSEIRSWKLYNLWTVEDFLEVCAMNCLGGLVSKSLAIVCRQSFERYRIIKSCKLHSAYWHLCIKEATKNKFFHVLNKLDDVSIERPRRLSVQNNILLGLKEVYETMVAVTSTTRSLLCTGVDHQYPVRIYFDMMLLKVLDSIAVRFYEFPEEVVKLLQLRYLSLTHNGELPSSINKLQQLQCLILRPHHNIKFPKTPTTYLPEQIWDIKELRHLRIMGSNLPDPLNDLRLPYLSTLYVNSHSCTQHVFRSIPNLKKLGIRIELQPDAAAETISCLEHIGVLNKLESLKCVVVNPRLQSQLAVAQPDHLSNLPRGLKKLSLNGLGYPWKYMSVIGSLPFLKVLKLRCSAFQGPHWETKAGQFWSLEYLLLEDIDLVHWTVQHSRFYKLLPSLSHLIVWHCYKLKEIPWLILKMLEVDDCSPSVVNSAQEWKKYSSNLQVVINSSWNL